MNLKKQIFQTQLIFNTKQDDDDEDEYRWLYFRFCLFLWSISWSIAFIQQNEEKQKITNNKKLQNR